MRQNGKNGAIGKNYVESCEKLIILGYFWDELVAKKQRKQRQGKICDGFVKNELSGSVTDKCLKIFTKVAKFGVFLIS